MKYMCYLIVDSSPEKDMGIYVGLFKFAPVVMISMIHKGDEME